MKLDPSTFDKRHLHHYVTAAMIPRPIAFVSTVGTDGVNNCAPFSFVSPLSSKPMIIGFTAARLRDGHKKDTLVNIEATGEYVINVVTETMAQAMNQAAKNYPPQVDEFREAGLTPLKSDLVKAPRIGESPVNLECRLMQILEFGAGADSSSFIIGEVALIHVADDFFKDGHIEFQKFDAVGRLGGDSYCIVKDIFDMKRPD
ncbi:MAG: flavin reductase family protein [Deltaproteobacteria bacterium]|nr:flavin reductase family protein [Deltaproteobacteria bacterium]